MFDQCKYIISAVSKKQYPNFQNFPEFVFLGRSNVGKSSFINALTGRKMLAKTSGTPGKTQTINFFLIDELFYIVDVPGYGYATTNFQQRENFGAYIQEYLTTSSNIKIAFLLIDFKVGPTKDDVLMFEYLQYLKLNIKIIATKCDKVGTTSHSKHLKQVKDKLSIDDLNILTTSASNKKGIEQVVSVLQRHLEV